MVLELLVAEEDHEAGDSGADAPGEAQQHERYAAERAAELWDRVGGGDPHADDWGQRDAQHERCGEHHGSGERGHEEGAGDVAAEHAVHEAPETVGVVASPPWHERAHAVDQALTVDEESRCEQECEEGRRQAVGHHARGALYRLRVDAESVGELVYPCAHLLGRVGVSKVVADERQVAEVIDHLRDVVAERAHLLDRRWHDEQEQHRRHDGHAAEHDPGRESPLPAGSRLESLDKGVEGEGQQQSDRCGRDEARHRLDEPDSGQQSR